MRIGSVLLLSLLLAACSAGPSRSPAQAAMRGDEPPEDFVIGVTVLGPAPTDSTARATRPARYIVQPDWILHAVQGPATDRTFPGQTRQLTHDQAQRLWWDLRDSGLLDPARTTGASPVPDGPLGAPVYLISYSVGGTKRVLMIDAAKAPPDDAAAARRLTDRLAALAWISQ